MEVASIARCSSSVKKRERERGKRKERGDCWSGDEKQVVGSETVRCIYRAA